MKSIEFQSDERLLKQCAHCGASVAGNGANRDHCPPRAWLERPLPSHPPWVRTCRTCNSATASEEEYTTAFLSVVLSGTAVPEEQNHSPARKILSNKPAIRQAIDKSQIRDPNGTLEWMPDFDKFARVIEKNARGHVCFELGYSQIGAVKSVHTIPLQNLSNEIRCAFETGPQLALWPEVGSRAMHRIVSGVDLCGSWVVVQDGRYRYRVHEDGQSVQSVIFEYLATDVIFEDG